MTTKHTCWTPLALSEGESNETEVKILEVGRKVQKGGAGEFEVTPEHLSEMVANFQREQAIGYEPPAIVGHPQDRSQAPAVGWIKSLRAAADGLYARVSFLSDFAARIRSGEFKHSSPTFAFSWHDETGAKRGAKLLDLGILNNPFQKALGAFALSEVGDDQQEPSMSNEIQLTEKVANLTRDLSERDTTIKTLSEARDGLTAQLAEARTEIETLTEKHAETEAARVALAEKVQTAETAQRASAIKTLCEQAVRDGKVKKATIPNLGTDKFDAIAWLSESPFNGIDGFAKFLKTADPVVDLSERESVGSSDDGVGDTSELEGRIAAAQAADPHMTRADAIALCERLA